MKNNISLIDSLILLQLERTNNKEAKDALIDIKGRVESIKLVYDKVLETEEYQVISIREYIEDFKLNSKQVFPLGVIVNEFITNSIKYAFKPYTHGTLSLDIKQKEENVLIHIRDNGKGLRPDILANPSYGFGTLLIHSMCQQLDSEYKLYNNDGLNLKIKHLEA